MKSKLKIFFTILLLMTICICFTNQVFADWKDLNQFDGYTSAGGAETSAKTVIGAIITVVRVLAVGIAIIMLLVLAIKYMYAAPGDKAEIKKHAVVYVVGAVTLFATMGILGIIQKFATVIN